MYVNSEILDERSVVEECFASPLFPLDCCGISSNDLDLHSATAAVWPLFQ